MFAGFFSGQQQQQFKKASIGSRIIKSIAMFNKISALHPYDLLRLPTHLVAEYHLFVSL